MIGWRVMIGLGVDSEMLSFIWLQWEELTFLPMFVRIAPISCKTCTSGKLDCLQSEVVRSQFSFNLNSEYLPCRQLNQARNSIEAIEASCTASVEGSTATKSWRLLRDLINLQWDENHAKVHGTLMCIFLQCHFHCWHQGGKVWMLKNTLHGSLLEKRIFHGQICPVFRVSRIRDNVANTFLLLSRICLQVLLWKIYILLDWLNDWNILALRIDIKEAHFRAAFCSGFDICHIRTLTHQLKWSLRHYAFLPLRFSSDQSPCLENSSVNLGFFIELFDYIAGPAFLFKMKSKVVAAVLHFKLGCLPFWLM